MSALQIFTELVCTAISNYNYLIAVFYIAYVVLIATDGHPSIPKKIREINNERRNEPQKKKAKICKGDDHLDNEPPKYNDSDLYHALDAWHLSKVGRKTFSV